MQMESVRKKKIMCTHIEQAQRLDRGMQYTYVTREKNIKLAITFQL